MTDRRLIRCDVCGSIIMVRTQVGWLPGHPIRIHCAKCGILISGDCIQDQENVMLSIEFQNAKIVKQNSCNIDYYVEVSGELLTSKIRKFVKDKDEYQPPPFFLTQWAMDDNDFHSYSEFKGDVLQFLYFIKSDWPYVRSLHELWLLKKYEYLPKQMRDYLPRDKFPLNNELEYLRGIHQLFLIGFRPVLPKGFYEVTTKAIFNNISNLVKENHRGYIALTEFFYDSGLLDTYENRIIQILNAFIDRYPFFVTVKGIDNYKKELDLESMGTTTVSFEDIKHFYLDCYETIGDLITLVLAYNNLKYRGDFQTLPTSSFRNITTLNDYIGKMNNKGNRIKFCENQEVFNHIIRLDTDNELRNAIGHGEYLYDGINQVIFYSSSVNSVLKNDKQIYLVDFIQKAWGQVQTIFILLELVYQTRKFYYGQHGFTSISINTISKIRTKKIGRNDPCPCGSGKKYKKCCGYNNI